MKSRSISALVFGLCFGIVFTVISFFTPNVHSYTCGGEIQKTYSIASVASIGHGCVGGGSTETIGFPFASAKKVVPPTTNPALLTDAQKSNNYAYQFPGILANLLAYGLFGFVFFFIFSRSRNKPKGKKSKRSDDDD